MLKYTALAIVLGALLAIPIIAHAILTPYQSGYKHGIDDATGKSAYLDWTSGWKQHTTQFNQGYIDGWCSLPGHKGQYVGSDADEGTFNCVDDVNGGNKTK